MFLPSQTNANVLSHFRWLHGVANSVQEASKKVPKIVLNCEEKWAVYVGFLRLKEQQFDDMANIHPSTLLSTAIFCYGR